VTAANAAELLISCCLWNLTADPRSQHSDIGQTSFAYTHLI